MTRRSPAPFALLALWAAAPLAWAQAPESERPAAAAERLLEEAGRDPERALGECEALLGRADLEGATRETLQRARARALAGAGRRDEAVRALRALLARGASVAGDLLALVGARLEVAKIALAPGEPARLALRGAATGPLELRLYAIDAARWRRAVEQEPERGLLGHLRAPPPPALTRSETWRAPALPPEGGALEVVTPRALAAGLHLLTVTARGVTLPVPLVVSRATAAVRRGVGEGALFLVDRRSGAPLADVELTALDPRGRPLGVLGRTGPAGGPSAGLLRYGGQATLASAWLEGGELALIELLPAAEAPPPRPAPLATELPRAVPGRTIRARAFERDVAGRLELLGPGGLAWASRPLEPDRSGLATAALPLPGFAPPGTWSLAIGEERHRLEVDPRPTPEVVLEARLTWAEGAPRVALAGRLITGAPLAGAAVRWRLSTTPAELAWNATEPRPLPRYAARVRGPRAALAAGEARLDAAGACAWSEVLPAQEGAHMLRLEAWVEDGPLVAYAWSELPRAPEQERVGLVVAPELAGPREVVRATIVTARASGEPTARRDLVIVEDGPRGQGEPRTLRTDELGRASTSYASGAPGPHRWEVRAAAGGERLAVATAWRAEGDRASQAPATLPAVERLELSLVEEASGLRGLLRAREPSGWALLTRETERLVDARVEPFVDGARWDPERLPPPGGRYAVTVHGARGWEHAAVERAETREPLQVVAHPPPAGAAGAVVRVRVESSGAAEQGAPRGRAARLFASLYPATSAATLDRGGVPAAPPATLVRGSAVAGQPIDEAATRPPAAAEWPRGLQAFAAAVAEPAGSRAWTNGAGVGELEVTLPDAPGTHWLRVEAVDSEGRRGAAWCPLVVVAPLTARLVAPTHACPGDRSEAVLVVRATAALAPDDVLTVSWRASGVAVGIPRVIGTRPVLRGDPGPRALRLEGASAFRVVLPLVAHDGLAAPGEGELEVSVALERDPASAVQRRASLPLAPRAARVVRAWTASAAPDAWARLALDLPREALPGRSTLEVAIDPAPITVALAALVDLERAPGLRARLAGLALRGEAARLLGERRLAPPRAPAPPEAREVEEAVALAAAARDAAGGWGPATADVVRALAALRRAGHDVPAGLLLAAPPRDDADARRLRATLGADPRLPAPGEPLPADLSAALLALAAEPAGLLTPRWTALLLEDLARSGVRPDLRDRLWAALLARRVGPGWPDPGAAAACLRAALALAAARGEEAAARVELQLEGRPLLESWSGEGLARWSGVARYDGPEVATRGRLRARAREVPLEVAARVTSWVRHQAPAGEGLTLTRTLTSASGAPATTARVGERLRLIVRIEERAAPPPGAGPLLLELPLPAGCALLERPPGASFARGTLSWELAPGEHAVELLALLPGEYALPPARVSDPARASERWAVSGEARLQLTAP